MSDKRAIAIFDSGLGGMSVLKECMKQMPYENYIYYGDSLYAPYGTKTKKEIIDRCHTICEQMLEEDVKAIVIACNTATSAAAPSLRDSYSIPIIGMEPALKVAASKADNQRIIVLATPFTLQEEKFRNLLKEYESKHTITNIACPELVQLVEQNELEDKAKVTAQLVSYFKHIDMNTAHSIVLGCTHFSFYIPFLHDLFPHCKVIDGNYGTVYHLKDILMRDKQLNETLGSIQIRNSDVSKIPLCEAWIEK